MRTVVVGNRALAKHVLAYLLESDWNVVGAVSAGGEAARKQAGYVPFGDLAEAHDLELIETADINDEETIDRLARLDPDLCICPGWHQIIDETVLDVPEQGFVGFHSSDLPRGRGGAPVNWSLIHGEPDVVISLFYYSSGVDAGDVIQKEFVEIEDRDDVDTVLDKLAFAACEALATTREAFESGDVEATSQSIEEATYRPRRQPQDGVVDWSRPAPELFDWVRAQTDPYPGAFTFYEGERVRIWSANPVDRSVDDVKPGAVVSVEDGRGVDVATGDGLLRLERLQCEGRPRAWADDFARRFDLTPGDSFGHEHAPSSWLYTGIRSNDDGTDFSAASNIRIDERGEVLAVVKSASERVVDVSATLDGDSLREERLAVEGRETLPIGYAPDSGGTHTLRVVFSEDGARIDVRYLKVFVSD